MGSIPGSRSEAESSAYFVCWQDIGTHIPITASSLAAETEAEPDVTRHSDDFNCETNLNAD
jgi:hypothetical protein